MTHHFLSHSTTEFITLGERKTRKCLSLVANSQQHLSTVDREVCIWGLEHSMLWRNTDLSLNSETTRN